MIPNRASLSSLGGDSVQGRACHRALPAVASVTAAFAIVLVLASSVSVRALAQDASATASPGAAATQSASSKRGASILKHREDSSAAPTRTSDVSAAASSPAPVSASAPASATASIEEPGSGGIARSSSETDSGASAHHGVKSKSKHSAGAHADRSVAKADSSSSSSSSEEAKNSAAGPFSSLQFTSNKGPINIKSDALDLDYKGNTVTFRGHVRAAQGDAILTSNTLTVTYAGKDFHDLKQMVADQNVRMSQGTRWATGDRAILDQTNHTVILTGSPVVHDGDDEVTGSKITVHLDTGKSEVEGARAMFFPNDQKTRDNKKATVAKSP